MLLTTHLNNIKEPCFGRDEVTLPVFLLVCFLESHIVVCLGLEKSVEKDVAVDDDCVVGVYETLLKGHQFVQGKLELSEGIQTRLIGDDRKVFFPVSVHNTQSIREVNCKKKLFKSK